MGLNLSSKMPAVSGASIRGRFTECRQVNFTLLRFSSVSYFSFHDDFKDLVELVGGEAFDILGAGFEVATYVGEDGEVGIDRGSITFEDFKIRFLSRQTEPNTFIAGDGMIKNSLDS